MSSRMDGKLFACSLFRQDLDSFTSPETGNYILRNYILVARWMVNYFAWVNQSFVLGNLTLIYSYLPIDVLEMQSCPFIMGFYPQGRCTEEENKLHISIFYSIKKQDRA